ncbi:MAG: hypothetical protein K2W96_10275, partial [Gemmataceae bacterium]|nr:hypothetical protein [Gemmataceae bacterium]
MNPPTHEWQRGASSAQPPPSRSWLYRVLGVLLAILLVGTAAAWVLLWLAPPGPAVLVVGVAGYEDNLAVAANPQGREAARRLAALAGSSSPLSSFFSTSGKLRGSLVEMKRNADWGRALENARERTAIVYLALHGGADGQGAFLYPNDATADPDDRLRLSAVLDRLEKLPADRMKLLLLDATGNGPDLVSGQLSNGFARALEAMDSRIAAIPGLVVISASSPDERSWPAADQRTSLFAQHLLDALGTQGLDAARLFARLEERIGNDAHRLYGARQRPMLLPKSDGLSRAARVSLTFKVEREEEQSPPDALPAVQAAWRD